MELFPVLLKYLFYSKPIVMLNKKCCQSAHNIVYLSYVYLVPYVESEDEIFLKTIIPSRKATRDYLGAK